MLAVAFAIGLTLDPRKLPSVLVGKPVPAFSLPPVAGRTLGLSDTDLRGQVSLVNVWASWCIECRAEHPFLMQLSASGIVPIHGIDYKDKPVDARNWLDGLGDPYTRTGADRDGRVAIDLGVYGVPETFLVNAEGTIVYKFIGALSWNSFNEKILPLIREQRGGSDAALDRSLGRAAMARADYADAAAAFARAHAVAGSDAGLAFEHARALIHAAEGYVSPQARTLLEETLAGDPENPMARFYFGLALSETAAELPRALAVWRELEAETPRDAPLLVNLREQIRRAEASLTASRDGRLRKPEPKERG